jgi:hypothetical protein
MMRIAALLIVAIAALLSPSPASAQEPKPAAVLEWWRRIGPWAVKGRSADGEELNYQGCDIYRFKDGKIVEKDTYWKIVEHKDRL